MLMNLATTGPDLRSSIQIQGAHWSGKSYFFFQSQGILRNDQGNFKYLRKSGKFLISAQTC